MSAISEKASGLDLARSYDQNEMQARTLCTSKLLSRVLYRVKLDLNTRAKSIIELSKLKMGEEILYSLCDIKVAVRSVKESD
ncbi:MAG TPA: hypothetical protein PKA63_09070 [Oligoflexia bacterium]|nr:hypothetical protein [Oligoflexia bacterium]HMP48803.1 hypothetical protein [Oligoflexia bacterium]